MKGWRKVLRLWEHPVFRRRLRTAPRGFSALLLVTALGVLCGGTILARATYYKMTSVTSPAPPPAPAPASFPTFTPSVFGYYTGVSPYRAHTRSAVDFMEALPIELQGRQFVRDLGLLLVLILALVAPGVSSQVYSQQKKHKNFDLLMLTPLRPASIVLGDWLGHALPLALVCLIALPFFVLSIAFGGVSLFEVASVYVITSALAFALVGVGLFCSTFETSTVVNSVLAYLLCLPLAAAALAGVELIATGSGNFLGAGVHRVSMEAAVTLLAVLVAALVVVNSLWWAIADFEYLYYSGRGEPVPGQKERFAEERL